MADPENGVPGMAEEPAQPPWQEEGEPANGNGIENPVPPGEEAHREIPDYRYCLKAPIFMGIEDVEQFIQEFSDVVAVTQGS